jgi:glycosyltransferase involved in cell wall biosynthesis
MRLSSAVLFYSDKEVLEYRKCRWFSERQPLSALNNGINVEPIRKLRSDYVVSKRNCSILFISRLTAKARLSLLLFALTNPSLSQVRLEVVGDGEEADALQAEALALGLGSRVRWHGGTIDEARIAAVANQCQIFVYPGEVGLSLIHAMAYGLPVIIHDDRWRHGPEIAAFDCGMTGLTFKAGNVDSLVTTISEALSDSPQLARWSAACVKIVDAQFNTAVMAQRFLALVEEVSAHR